MWNRPWVFNNVSKWYATFNIMYSLHVAGQKPNCFTLGRLNTFDDIAWKKLLQVWTSELNIQRAWPLPPFDWYRSWPLPPLTGTGPYLAGWRCLLEFFLQQVDPLPGLLLQLLQSGHQDVILFTEIIHISL